MHKLSIFWFRRDLRLDDNHGLFQALKSGHPVLPVFIFDRNILDELQDRSDARVTFLHQELTQIQHQLRAFGSDLYVFYGNPTEVYVESILPNYPIAAVYTNHDFEPYARQRDTEIGALCAKQSVDFKTFKDHVIFQYDEVLKDDGKPYVVFTPYSRRWKALAQATDAFQAFDTSGFTQNYAKVTPEKLKAIPSLESMRFTLSALPLPEREVKAGLIRTYDETRNFPALPESTSRLGLHFRFGTISIREKARKASQLNETFLNELIWRDFYAQIIGHFPHVVTAPFRPEYAHVPWRTAPDEFEKWCNGQTGYPLVDAGMRELNTTGYMHNRVRMVVASFLTKHLLLNWQLGEAYFAEKLLDFDLASNSGGWQWAAGCGTDAAPYFRIFNPEEQMKKFDSKFVYVKKWVPEYGTPKYAQPIVEHKFARERCLAAYKQGLAK
jgi:deoxyribodipyrimidine photo-lyase